MAPYAMQEVYKRSVEEGKRICDRKQKGNAPCIGMVQYVKEYTLPPVDVRLCERIQTASMFMCSDLGCAGCGEQASLMGAGMLCVAFERRNAVGLFVMTVGMCCS